MLSNTTNLLDAFHLFTKISLTFPAASGLSLKIKHKTISRDFNSIFGILWHATREIAIIIATHVAPNKQLDKQQKSDLLALRNVERGSLALLFLGFISRCALTISFFFSRILIKNKRATCRQSKVKTKERNSSKKPVGQS